MGEKIKLIFKKGIDRVANPCYNIDTVKERNERRKAMYRLTHIKSGFEWTFATIEEAIEYLETFERQEEFEIRR